MARRQKPITMQCGFRIKRDNLLEGASSTLDEIDSLSMIVSGIVVLNQNRTNQKRLERF
jgi:hypothetical protein